MTVPYGQYKIGFVNHIAITLSHAATEIMIGNRMLQITFEHDKLSCATAIFQLFNGIDRVRECRFKCDTLIFVLIAQENYELRKIQIGSLCHTRDKVCVALMY